MCFKYLEPVTFRDLIFVEVMKFAKLRLLTSVCTPHVHGFPFVNVSHLKFYSKETLSVFFLDLNS